ncbi:fumarylacetoacetate hydrolase family protein [Herbiconiux ginsengi]|uniref:2-keto-4-pentenoate hydratase/2-oxohepta-3-ene-1,7-dioic acid hydratase (Catechol pathway) n=1 Tax=Herbiconiux ginsengi TaxID=381665 RepID=A0A1H3KVH5_9MICO|nr:fumarylacetoacetate hydrolase family protein [Herbiconiux ginsengi]SDY55989.1 2-keto-4-pentenoate hydratase/2-oxohepta-3-ene-1,7-dioic acid hydratase (catechol pathway) [Herbiconiux ginsengi]
MQLAALRTSRGETVAAVSAGGGWAVVDGATDISSLVSRVNWRSDADAALASGRRITGADALFANPLPNPAKVICCGLNYADHIAETGREVPEFPTLFAKFADTLTGPDADITVTDSTAVDWEAELAVVIGSPLRHGDRAAAQAAILGYTIANDISMRDWQSRTLQWFQGKAFDATTPVGPVIVTADEFDPADGAEITCHIGDELMQRSDTARLVFDAPALVSYSSGFTALAPGDLVLTGTPGGVGLGRKPRRYLADQEVVITRIAGIGELRNRIVLGDRIITNEERHES